MHFFFLFLWPVTRALHFVLLFILLRLLNLRAQWELGHPGAEVQLSRFVSYQNWKSVGF